MSAWSANFSAYMAAPRRRKISPNSSSITFSGCTISSNKTAAKRAAACREFIRDLQALPHPPTLGLLTGNIQLGAEIKLRHFGLWELFEFGGFADDHEDRNHIAAAALERGRRVLGKNLRPEEIVVVGDTPFDIRCGKFIGAKVLAVATGGAKLDELKRHQPDWAVEDLTRVTAREIC